MKVRKVNRNSLIIFTLSALVVAQFVIARFEKPEAQYVPQYYKTKMNESKERVKELTVDVNRLKVQIKSIKNEMDIKDSIILNADPNELKDLLSDFFNSVR